MINTIFLSSKILIAWITKEGVTLYVCYSCSLTQNIHCQPLSGASGMCCRGFWYHPAHLSGVPGFLFCFKRETSISAPNADLQCIPTAAYDNLMPYDNQPRWQRLDLYLKEICLSSKEINGHFLDMVVREEVSITHPTEETLVPVDRGSDWEKGVTFPHLFKNIFPLMLQRSILSGQRLNKMICVEEVKQVGDNTVVPAEWDFI